MRKNPFCSKRLMLSPKRLHWTPSGLMAMKVYSLLAVDLGIDSPPAARVATLSGAACTGGAQKDSEASLGRPSPTHCIPELYKAPAWVLTGFHSLAENPDTQHAKKEKKMDNQMIVSLRKPPCFYPQGHLSMPASFPCSPTTPVSGL